MREKAGFSTPQDRPQAANPAALEMTTRLDGHYILQSPIARMSACFHQILAAKCWDALVTLVQLFYLCVSACLFEMRRRRLPVARVLLKLLKIVQLSRARLQPSLSRLLQGHPCQRD